MRYINEEIFLNPNKPPFMSVYWAMPNFDSLVVKESDIKKSNTKSKKLAPKKSLKVKINKTNSPEKKKNAK